MVDADVAVDDVEAVDCVLVVSDDCVAVIHSISVVSFGVINVDAVVAKVVVDMVVVDIVVVDFVVVSRIVVVSTFVEDALVAGMLCIEVSVFSSDEEVAIKVVVVSVVV